MDHHPELEQPAEPPPSRPRPAGRWKVAVAEDVRLLAEILGVTMTAILLDALTNGRLRAPITAAIARTRARFTHPTPGLSPVDISALHTEARRIVREACE